MVLSTALRPFSGPADAKTLTLGDRTDLVPGERFLQTWSAMPSGRSGETCLCRFLYLDDRSGGDDSGNGIAAVAEDSDGEAGGVDGRIS